MLKFLDKHGDRMRYFVKNNLNYHQSSKKPSMVLDASQGASVLCKMKSEIDGCYE